MTKSATRTDPGRARRRRLVIVLPSVGLLILANGCASWNSLGQRQTVFSGTFWNRSSRSDATPRYDLYADNAAAARPDTGADTALASREEKSGPKDRSGNPSAKAAAENHQALEKDQDGPPLEPPVTDRVASRVRDPKTSDSSIRVTLGRPEGLAIAPDSGAAAGPLLASGASTHWKRSEDPQARGKTGEAMAESGPRDAERGRASRALDHETDSSPRVASRMPRKPANRESVKGLLADARSRLDALSTYQVSITRVERVGGQLQAEGEALLSIRRNPKAVRLEWANGPSKGREVIYSSAINDRMLYVHMANSALPIPRMTIPVDSPLVLKNSRHPITEAGFDTIFENMSRSMTSSASGVNREGTLVYRGLERPKGMDQPCHLLERETPAGETWQVYLDPKTLMPTVVAAYQTQGGELIERYTYRNVRPNPVDLAAADAFDPDKRWGESNGWLSRLARSAGANADAKPGQTTTR